jgi:cell division protein FtsX
MTKSQRNNLFFALAFVLMVLGGTTTLPVAPYCIIIGFFIAWFLVPNDKI